MRDSTSFAYGVPASTPPTGELGPVAATIATRASPLETYRVFEAVSKTAVAPMPFTTLALGARLAASNAARPPGVVYVSRTITEPPPSLKTQLVSVPVPDSCGNAPSPETQPPTPFT